MSEVAETTQNQSESSPGEFGPIQLLVIGFPRTDQFKGEVLDELAILEERGTIRVLDLLYVEKVSDDDLIVLEIDDLDAEAQAFGGILSAFLGIDGAEQSGKDTLEAIIDGEVFGLSSEQAHASLARIPVGSAAGIILFEHIWAIHFRDAARRAGGYPLLQGFLTSEAMLMIGEETRVLREAAIAMEFAEIVEGAALLDAAEAVASAAAVVDAAEIVENAAIEEATAVEAYAATRAVRALIAAGVIEQYAAAEAIAALRNAGMLGPE